MRNHQGPVLTPKKAFARLNSTTTVPLRFAIGAILVLLIIGGIATLTGKKGIDVEQDGQRYHVVTMARDVGTAIIHSGFSITEENIVYPPLETPTSNGMVVRIGKRSQTSAAVRLLEATVGDSAASQIKLPPPPKIPKKIETGLGFLGIDVQPSLTPQPIPVSVPTTTVKRFVGATTTYQPPPTTTAEPTPVYVPPPPTTVAAVQPPPPPVRTVAPAPAPARVTPIVQLPPQISVPPPGPDPTPCNPGVGVVAYGAQAIPGDASPLELAQQQAEIARRAALGQLSQNCQ